MNIPKGMTPIITYMSLNLSNTNPTDSRPHRMAACHKQDNSMRQLSNEFIQSTASTIWSQVRATASPDVIGSWGISELYAQEVIFEGLHMAALVMKVSGFALTGFAVVALDEAQDLYRIFTAETEDAELVQRHSGVYCDSLADVLDNTIERGNMTKEQYKKRIHETYINL